MASEKLSATLQVISKIYVNLQNDKKTLAISQATALFPSMKEEICQIVNILDSLSARSTITKDSLELAFELVISLNETQIGRSLTSILQLIQHVRNYDREAAIVLVASEYFQRSPEQAVPFVSDLSKVFFQTSDQFEILKILYVKDELKTDLSTYLLSIYQLAKEFERTKKSTDKTKINLLKTTLNIVSSCLSNEVLRNRLAAIYELIESIESNDVQRVLNQFQVTLKTYLPPGYYDHLESIFKLLHKKLNRQSITDESILSIANSLFNNEEKQILKNTNKIINTFPTEKTLSDDEYLAISIELMSLFGIDTTQIHLFEAGKNTRNAVMRLTRMIQTFPPSTMRNKQAEQLSFLVQTAFDLISSSRPDHTDAIRAAFFTISSIAMFLKANNTITLVLEAIGLAINGTQENLFNDTTHIVTRIETKQSVTRPMLDKKEELIKSSISYTMTLACPVSTQVELNRTADIHRVSISHGILDENPITPEPSSPSNISLENRVVAEKEIRTLTQQIVRLNQESDEQITSILQHDDFDLSQTITYLSKASQINKTI
ncbi:unnamed protein product, partial [Adineta ricciae]